MPATLRVIQWTTGNIGRRSLHAILSRPDMELVGVFAHGADKLGKDAAELCGWPEPTGVLATNDVDALLALGADACCYNPLWPSIDELVRLLESGVNVCSSAAWITGGKQSPEDQARIRARSESLCLPPVIQAALVHTLTPRSSSATRWSTSGHSGL